LLLAWLNTMWLLLVLRVAPAPMVSLLLPGGGGRPLWPWPVDRAE